MSVSGKETTGDSDSAEITSRCWDGFMVSNSFRKELASRCLLPDLSLAARCETGVGVPRERRLVCDESLQI